MSQTRSHSIGGKATIICQSCDHVSPLQGDWNVTEPTAGGDCRVYECPDCGFVVLTQPVLSALA